MSKVDDSAVVVKNIFDLAVDQMAKLKVKCIKMTLEWLYHGDHIVWYTVQCKTGTCTPYLKTFKLMCSLCLFVFNCSS